LHGPNDVGSGIFHTLTLGIAVVSGDFAHAQNSPDEIVHFMKKNEDAELVKVEEHT
jgi:uncharacterized protein YlxP (DUF503 family)